MIDIGTSYDIVAALTLYSLVRSITFTFLMNTENDYERRKAVQELIITFIMVLITLAMKK